MARREERRGGRDREERGRDDRGSRRNDRTREERRTRGRDDDDRDRGGGGRDRGGDRDRGGGRDRGARGGGSRPGGGSFVYKERSADAAKKRAERTGGNFDSIFKGGIDTWRPKTGDNYIRILPPTWEDHDHYGLLIWVHSYVGADDSTYLCLRKMQGKRCPICDEAQAAKKEGDDEEGKRLSAKEAYVVWMIDRDDKADPPTPAVWMMGWSQDRDIASLAYDKKKGKLLLIDHPDKGYDLMFQRQGAGLRTKYFGYQFDRDATPILDDQKDQDDILDYITKNPLPDILNYYDEKYLQKVMEGTNSRSDRDEDLDDDNGDDGGDDDAGEDTRDRGNDDGDDDGDRRDRRRGRDRDDRGNDDGGGDDGDDNGDDPDDGDDDGDGDGNGDDAGDDAGDDPPPRRGGRERPRSNRDRDEKSEDDPPPRRGGRDREERGGRRERPERSERPERGGRGGGSSGRGGGRERRERRR